MEKSYEDTITCNRNVHQTLDAVRLPTASRVREILARAESLVGLDDDDIAILAEITDRDLLEELFHTARKVKERIYGKRLVLFAPLYISNRCCNECLYCAFRTANKEVVRRSLNQQEIADEVTAMVSQGHKRLLLVAGEAMPRNGLQYILDAIETVYATKVGQGEIRRVNVNIAPLNDEQFRQLKQANIGTYQLFQETYHRETYRRMHLSGPKADYDWRYSALDRAMAAGIDDVGIGVLFGLYDWKYEILALMQHIRHLEKEFGVGPHTISVPRLEPATGSEISAHPAYGVKDIDFMKIVAILRLAVPYTGIIMSTRENPAMRSATLALGVSQISAGSRTNPGGYAGGGIEDRESQFSLGDHRSLEEVITDITSLGYIPSFCTGCYRLGRTGKDFMDLAKPGDIRMHCDPNAVSTFEEYLQDYASLQTRELGHKAIEAVFRGMDDKARTRAATMAERVRNGSRDVYC